MLKDFYNIFNNCENIKNNTNNTILDEIKNKTNIYNDYFKDNFRFYCRIKPSINYSKNINILNDKDLIIQIDDNQKKYKFDFIFNQSSTQKNIFNEMKKYIYPAIDMFNICFISYGENNSGKTFTLFGENIRKGIIFNTVNELFEIKKDNKLYNINYNISMIATNENETIDLLSNKVINLYNDFIKYIEDGFKDLIKKKGKYHIILEIKIEIENKFNNSISNHSILFVYL